MEQGKTQGNLPSVLGVLCTERLIAVGVIVMIDLGKQLTACDCCAVVAAH